MLGCSATLDDATRQVVIKNGGFRNPQILNTTTDRPDVYFEIRSDRSLGKSHMGLRFLVPDRITMVDVPQLIDKTIVFFDSKQNIRLARVEIRRWLVGAGLSFAEAHSIVGVYYASIGSKTKERIIADFAASSSSCRIMLATEAMGMGVEIVGVKNVVQYDSRRITRSISELKVLVQRMGRAARGEGEEGHFIWLVRPWVLPSLQPHAVPYQRSSGLSATQTIDYEDDVPGRSKKSIRDQRAAIDSVYRDLCTGCPRAVLQRFFTPTGSRLLTLPPLHNRRCCFRCQPHLTYQDKSMWTHTKMEQVEKMIAEEDKAATQVKDPRLLLALPPNTKLMWGTNRYGPAANKLREWRQTKSDELTKVYRGRRYHPELILPDEILDRLAQGNGHYALPLGAQYIHHFLQDWSQRFEFGEEIQRLLADLIYQQTHKLIPHEGQNRNQFLAKDRQQEKREMEAIIASRRRAYVRRYGDSVDPLQSQLPGDRVDKWVKAQEAKEKRATKAREKKAATASQSQPERATESARPQRLDKFMAGPDEDEEASQIDSPRSDVSTQERRTRKVQPRSKTQASQSQSMMEPSTPSQLDTSFVTAREEQSSDSSLVLPSSTAQSFKTPRGKGKERANTPVTPLAHRPSPVNKLMSRVAPPSALKPSKSGQSRTKTVRQSTPIPSSSGDSDTSIASQAGKSRSGRQRYMSKRLLHNQSPSR